MPDSIEDVRAIAFGETVHHLVQQKPSRFLPWVMKKNPTNSKMCTFPRLGAFELEQITNRHGDTKLLDIGWSNRVAFKADYGGALPLDEEDELENILNPIGEYATSSRGALNRLWDDVALTAVRGSASEGETGSTAVALPAAQKETTVSGLTLAKILNGQKILRESDEEISPESTVMVISPEGLLDVLSETDNVFRSRDFNPLAPLTTGSIAQYLGMTWVVSTRLPILSGTIRGCYIWQQRAIGFCAWRMVKTSLDRRADKNNMMQLLVKTHVGAVRIEDKLVVELQVTE